MKEQPKFRPSFDGCYNYEKLKDEGLVEEESTEDPIILIHTTHNDGCYTGTSALTFTTT